MPSMHIFTDFIPAILCIYDTRAKLSINRRCCCICKKIEECPAALLNSVLLISLYFFNAFFTAFAISLSAAVRARLSAFWALAFAWGVSAA